ncbi:Glycosyl hydrolases family 18 [Streptoalloteichus tenebrarius]|uniref:Glycosyl hydrolases family 18 n=1 Tax=Streptoalloteichus tenebrarius (strain ATCC 17920 / DSM 40477 / JCM 4838 / CBS 697.72 / NBRC 16177 / NCIMB 11028 / NRRL B-12390 / A12253. 1 / ISP 5477) TaxID=1933 RepID=A0ABT1HWM5_STRSD|nr:cellulose binding domain-containing protein [Streptoalloteichus tenebrarius]MCP2259928.1 Glycosyl hydrolases family 18 [Streptoalloteichus tenebrarius]BFF03252.1 cellulose binding domain-containing protein [Streptoalloteichus tenebrarius]
MRFGKHRWAAVAAAALLPVTGLLLAGAPAGAENGPTATFATTSAWDSGYTGRYTITAGSSTLDNWTLEFDLPSGSGVTSAWDAAMTRDGDHYRFTPRDYNRTVQPGASTSFGFNGTGTGTPLNCTLNGQPCGGGGGTPTTTVTTTTSQDPGPGPGPSSYAAAPYYYYGWGNPQPINDVMKATGVKTFTLAFILAGGGCTPAWDGHQPVSTDTRYAALIRQVRAAGGDVMPSIGGWAGSKLGEACSDAQSLANAYQQVIDKYSLKAIDLDIENTEFENPAAQDRIMNALRIVRQKNPGIKIYVTIPALQSGMNRWGTDLVKKAVSVGVEIDAWTLMPFNFGATDLGDATIRSMEAQHGQLKALYPGRSDAEVYRMQGISSMNGRTDNGEYGYQSDFQDMLAYARQKNLGRFTFWAVNRDRQCPNQTPGSRDDCSGVTQQPYDFTKIVAQYR